MKLYRFELIPLAYSGTHPSQVLVEWEKMSREDAYAIAQNLKDRRTGRTELDFEVRVYELNKTIQYSSFACEYAIYDTEECTHLYTLKLRTPENTVREIQDLLKKLYKEFKPPHAYELDLAQGLERLLNILKERN